nr:MAG TPA: terminase small subunit [Caudoviricetes sp.]
MRARYTEWLEKDKLLLIQGWKRDGLTDEQIARNMSINPRTLEKWKANYEPIRQAIKRGRTEVNFIVENKLLKKALDGNTTAIIFWLKNNWRDKYNDSALGPEERKMIQAKMRKLEADTRVSEAKAKLAEQVSSQNNAELERMLKLLEVEGTEDGD